MAIRKRTRVHNAIADANANANVNPKPNTRPNKTTMNGLRLSLLLMSLASSSSSCRALSCPLSTSVNASAIPVQYFTRPANPSSANSAVLTYSCSYFDCDPSEFDYYYEDYDALLPNYQYISRLYGTYFRDRNRNRERRRKRRNRQRVRRLGEAKAAPEEEEEEAKDNGRRGQVGGSS